MKKSRIIENIIENKRIVSEPDYRDLGAVLLFIFLLPYIISFFFGNVGAGFGENKEGEEAVTVTEIYKEDWENSEYIVCNKTAAGIEKMPLETYLTCRLPATVSMDYEPETLKAQAVILRTELISAYINNTDHDIKGKQTKDGKKYIFVESSLSVTDGKEYEKCKDAVSATKGMYLTYDGYPIKAPYFAVSAGATRNGNEVFENEDYPYLKSVICERDFTSSEYVQTIQMNKTAFMLRLQEISPDILLNQEQEITEQLTIERDRAEYVTQIGAENSSISGEAFRAAFSLNSSCFTVEEENNSIAGDAIVIKTKGIGHGLGYCQYGANEAAKKGSDFIDILNYFFTDIVIEKTE